MWRGHGGGAGEKRSTLGERTPGRDSPLGMAKPEAKGVQGVVTRGEGMVPETERAAPRERERAAQEDVLLPIIGRQDDDAEGQCRQSCRYEQPFDAVPETITQDHPQYDGVEDRHMLRLAEHHREGHHDIKDYSRQPTLAGAPNLLLLHRIKRGIERQIGEKRREDDDIKGKEVTPFLLQYIATHTNGESLDTNIALILNNAKVGSEVAVAYSKKHP
mgnify:CR=1 FL=1